MFICALDGKGIRPHPPLRCVPTTFGFAEVDPKGKARDRTEYFAYRLIKCCKSNIFLDLIRQIGDFISLPLGEGGPLAVDEVASKFHKTRR